MDSITLAVLRGALEQIAEEMDTMIAASAISPVIADAWDRASGIFHPETGEVIVQGSTGLPIFIVVMQHTVQEVLKAHPPETLPSAAVAPPGCRACWPCWPTPATGPTSAA